jgi:hypothetical protein
VRSRIAVVTVALLPTVNRFPTPHPYAKKRRLSESVDAAQFCIAGHGRG